MRTEAFIGGEFVPAADGRTFDDVSPRDGSVIAAVARSSAEDVDRAVRAARMAFEAGDWALADPRDRKHVLLTLAGLIDGHAEELARLESADVGHPISDARGVDVVNARDCFAWYAEAIDKVYGEIAPTGADAVALVGREPFGVVGAVVPWNYPMIITAWKLAPALAAGNSVVLKPAEQSPLTALRIAELAAEAGVPAGVLNVVPGYGDEAGEPLGRHYDVDKLAFTGSVEVGHRFLVYAGESNGKSVSLELGGKSPHVVLADAADLDDAAEAVGWGIFYNAGQTCHAGSRVVVAEQLADGLAERLVRFAGELHPADPADPATRLGAIISEEHLGGVLARVQRAADGGARVLVGGARAQPAHRVARRLRAGTVWVNTFDMSSMSTPFGGFKGSGHGRDRSLHALDAYTQLKTTWISL